MFVQLKKDGGNFNDFLVKPLLKFEPNYNYSINAEIQFYADTPQLDKNDSFIIRDGIHTLTIDFPYGLYIQTVSDLIFILNREIATAYTLLGLQTGLQIYRDVLDHSRLALKNITEGQKIIEIKNSNIKKLLGMPENDILIQTPVSSSDIKFFTNPYDLIRTKQYVFFIEKGEENAENLRNILAIVTNPYPNRAFMFSNSSFSLVLKGYQLNNIGRVYIEDETGNKALLNNQPVINLRIALLNRGTEEKYGKPIPISYQNILTQHRENIIAKADK